MKLQDLLKDIELGKVYTDKDRQPFKVNEGMRRFKVYVSGESEPLVLFGKDIKDAMQTARKMVQNSNKKITKVVKEEKLTEALWKAHGGKHIISPTGETTSIPSHYDRDAVLVTIKRDTFKIYNGNAGRPYAIGNKYDKEFKNTNDLVKWLNKEKAKYLGIDRR